MRNLLRTFTLTCRVLACALQRHRPAGDQSSLQGAIAEPSALPGWPRLGLVVRIRGGLPGPSGPDPGTVVDVVEQLRIAVRVTDRVCIHDPNFK